MTVQFGAYYSSKGTWSAGRLILSLACITAIACSPLVTAAEAETSAQPQPATSILVFHYPPDPMSKNRTEFPMIMLADMPDKKGEKKRDRKRDKKRDKKNSIKSKTRLSLGRKVGLQTMEVPAGQYYIRQIRSDNLNFQRSPRPVPKSGKEVVQIPPGVVAYLGNVSWDADMGTQMNFSREGLLELQKESDLHSKPLYLVAFGMEPRSVSWE